MAVFLTCYEQMRGFSLEDRLTVLFDSLTNVISRFTITDMFTKGLCVTVEDFDAKGLAPVYEKNTQDYSDRLYDRQKERF